MSAFEKELMRRSPLAAAVLEMADHIFSPELLGPLYAMWRGRCYEDKLTFDQFVRLTRDALIHHKGSAHKLFVELKRSRSQPIDKSNYYRKLARMPVEISRALLREGTGKLRELIPEAAVKLPACVDGFEVIIGDGKKIKNAAKRLKLTRGYSGRLIGAKALVAVDVRSGLALAMNDSLDGQTNDVPLVPGLMDQLRQMISRPLLTIWDRQFDDPRTLGRLSQRPGDGFIVRMKQMQMPFHAESSLETRDSQGRIVRDEIGMLGSAKPMRARRITLLRGEEADDVILLSNLLDGELFSAEVLLELYRKRWGIEQVFQQVTETFSLSHLIGSAPQAVLFQFAYCLLLYNLMQVVKLYVAEDGGVLAALVSMYYLFSDVRDELRAWAYHTDGTWPRFHRDPAAMRRRLRELLRGSWTTAYTKAVDKKPRGKPKIKLRLHGGHTSVQRLLEGKARVIA